MFKLVVTEYYKSLSTYIKKQRIKDVNRSNTVQLSEYKS